MFIAIRAAINRIAVHIFIFNPFCMRQLHETGAVVEMTAVIAIKNLFKFCCV